MRGADWLVAATTRHADCTAIDLVGVARPVSARTLLVPFDRPRRARPPRLEVTSPSCWREHVAAVVARTFPYGGLRFCPPAIQLLAYQLEPALAVFRHGATRLLVADEVGLGKTVEAGLVIREMLGRKATARVLVVVPASLRTQWKEELSSLFEVPAIDATAAWLRASTRELPPDVNPWSIPGVYLASIDFAKRPEALSPLEAVRWDLLVVDEAHSATPGTGRLAAVDALGCRSSTVLLLSATPHSGDQVQFDALCRIGMGAERSAIVCFRRTRADIDVAPAPVRSRAITVTPTECERGMHRLLEGYTAMLWASAGAGADTNPALLATTLRKRALSSAHSLAVSLRRRLLSLQPAAAVETQPWLPLTATDEDDRGDEVAPEVVNGRGLDDRAGEQSALEQNLRLAEAAAAEESKTLVLLRLLARVREPAIVFSEYRDTALRLRERIAAAGHRVLMLHGGLGADEQISVTAEFNRGGSVLVATDAASEGLNLHHCCRLVVHYELPWSPSRLLQRCGRVNRIGQRRRVHEIALVAADTAEQMVLQPLLRRIQRSGAFVGRSFVHQLPESRVAGHVLGGLPLTQQRPTSADASHQVADVLQTLDLRAEGLTEAERLATVRRMQAASGAESRAVIPVARPEHSPFVRCTGPRQGRSQSLTIVCSIRFSEADGGVVEEVLVPLAVDYAGRRWRSRPSTLRRQVRSCMDALDPQLQAVVRTRATARAAGITAAHFRVASARHARRQAVAHTLRSTAKAMVQMGLFGRGSMRSASLRPVPEPLETPRSEEEPRAGLVWQSAVEAIVLGRLT